MIVIHLFLWMLMNLWFKSGIEDIHTAVIQEKTAILGVVLENAPDLEGEILPILGGNATQEQIKLGQAVAKKYGLTEELPVVATTVFAGYQTEVDRKLTFYLLLSLLLSSLVGLCVLGNVFKKIRVFSGCAEAIVEGDFKTILESQEEGDLAILALQYNQMAKRLQGSVENLKKEKEFLKEMVSDISHQLKTPLTSIKMLNELLLEGELEDIQRATDFLGKSHTQVERMEWLIQNLLKMAKLETNSIDFKNKPLSITETIQKAIIPLEKICHENKQELIIDSKEQYIANHNQDWLSEAISNIVKNAIEHTPSGGKIIITVTDSPIAFKIIIDNQGKPIPSDDIPRLFDRFFKGKNNQRPNSTGIGLALAKAIIEKQNGTIEARNRQEGPSFIIHLYKYESF